MPYIPPEDRDKLDAFADGLARNADNVGELTYALTRIVKGYVARRGQSFAHKAEGFTALHCAASEYYREDLGPYEASKREANGAVCCGADCENCTDGDTAHAGW